MQQHRLSEHQSNNMAYFAEPTIVDSAKTCAPAGLWMPVYLNIEAGKPSYQSVTISFRRLSESLDQDTRRALPRGGRMI